MDEVKERGYKIISVTNHSENYKRMVGHLENDTATVKSPSRYPAHLDNLMIDIETLGRTPNAVIIEIAAVQFNPRTGQTGKSINLQIDQQSCVDLGLQIDEDTVEWWSNQKHHYQWRITNPIHLKVALIQLTDFIKQSVGEDGQVWANGTDFDIAILRNAYDKCQMDFPYPYYNSRDVRTISKMYPHIRDEYAREGAHDPLADCLYQIGYLCQTLKMFAP